MYKLLKKILVLLFIVFVNYSYSQNIDAENIIKSTIHTFFEGLQKGDTILVNQSINSTLKLQTIFKSKEGLNVLKTETKEDFFNSISKKDKDDVWLEKLMSMNIKVDGGLASVWIPYEFYFNSKFSHCGVNSFQLFNNNGTWEIIYLVDTRTKKDCKLSE